MLPRLPVPRLPPTVMWAGGVAMTLGVAAVVVFGLVPRVLGHYFWSVERLYRPAPQQPVEFTHPSHVEKAGLDCLFCHRTVETRPEAGLPPVEFCYFCHRFIGQGRAEPPVPPLPAVEAMNRLVGFDRETRTFTQPAPINWVRVHRLPDHTRFTHEAHVRFFVRRDKVPPSATCITCHGDVAKMQRVWQERSLRMSDCVNCHREYEAPTDCWACHY